MYEAMHMGMTPIICLSNVKENETKIIYLFTPSSCVDFDI
jgi:hypothetical protein